ncbi:MAG: murein biosynthesis integral membrane protein MurJ [Ruminococcaceae bacterium]|nr:murein biosynthesis integral membrane protein MurJ [Oscillospiraceae bacterium]
MKNTNTKNGLAKSALIMGIIILLSKVLGLVRDMMIAASYGTTDAAIAYETASKLPITVFDFILGGVVTSAFIPVYNRIAVEKNKKDALSFASSYVNMILLITVSLSVLGCVFSGPLVSLIAPELNESTALLASELTRIMFPMVIFVGLAFSFVGFLQSEGEYNIPALISLVSNLIMIGYLLTLGDRFGVKGLSWAMLIGWGAQAAVQIPSVIKKGFKYSIKSPVNSPEVLRAAKNTLPILIATWTTPVCNLINTRLASGIDGGRAITALGYGNRLYTIIVGLFSFVATNLLFPYFSRAAASGLSDENDRLTRTSIKTLAFIIMPISVGVASLSESFVSLIYENGTFNSSDTLITAEALRFYAVGMVFAAISEVLTKAFFAVEKMKIPMISSVISMTFNVIVIVVLGSRLGIGGIALISGVSAGVNMIINLVFAYRKKLISFSIGDYKDLTKSLVSALLMGAAVFFVSELTSDLGRALSFVISVAAGVIVYAALTAVLRSDEIKMFAGMLRKKTGKESA